MSLPPRVRPEQGGGGARAPRWVWPAYGLLGLVLAAYVVSLILRSPEQSTPLLDGWLVGVFEIAGGALCIWRGFLMRTGRSVAFVLGAALLAWAAGDLALTAETMGGADVATPSLADAFYLAFYPLAYVGLVLVIRRNVPSVVPATWLDGIVAGLGAAAVCASFAFGAIVSSLGSNPLSVATNLAYPIGDLLLLALVVGGTAVRARRLTLGWALLGGACAVNALGDSLNLVHSGAGATPSHLGFIIDGVAWPTATLLISMSMWLFTHRPRLSTPFRAPGFALPGLGAAAALAILFVGTRRDVGAAGLGLATATLLTAGVRMALSARSLRGITEERSLQSITDELTSLGNRRHLFQLLDGHFASQADPATPRRGLGFLFVDLDHFKEINDSFGHAAGDELLRQIGPRLAGSLRDADVLVRLGGDELGVVLMDADADEATAVAERITAKLEEPFAIRGVSVRISASVGIAFAPVHATATADLLHCADLAMYRAKMGSTTTIAMYREDIDDTGNRLLLLEELHRAVDQGEFALHYQPQVDLRSGEFSAVEALLRWPHLRLGSIQPLDFLPLAEEAGLMGPITSWVLDQALAQCAAWRRHGDKPAVAVNVSASNLIDDGFTALVSRMLARHGLPASALILEITETTIIADFDRCKRVIAELQHLGVDVSIDDFGAGFTSLAYLGSLAVHELKLDRTFIEGLGSPGPTRDLALVRATIELGHALGLRVVAEGIEDRGTLDVLAQLGCDLGQGYFISRPVPAAELVLSRESLVSASA